MKSVTQIKLSQHVSVVGVTPRDLILDFQRTGLGPLESKRLVAFERKSRSVTDLYFSNAVRTRAASLNNTLQEYPSPWDNC
jgi:hypothetical protein